MKNKVQKMLIALIIGGGLVSLLEGTTTAKPQDWGLAMLADPAVVECPARDTTISVAVTHLSTETETALVECPAPDGGDITAVSGGAVPFQGGVIWVDTLEPVDMKTFSYTVRAGRTVTEVRTTCALYVAGISQAEATERVSVVPCRLLYLPVLMRQGN